MFLDPGNRACPASHNALSFSRYVVPTTVYFTGSRGKFAPECSAGEGYNIK